MADRQEEMRAGAELFDRTANQMSQISAAAFERDGGEDFPARVNVLLAGLRAALAGSPDFRFGFLLPLADLIDNARLGLIPSDLTGVGVLRNAAAVMECGRDG